MLRRPITRRRMIQTAAAAIAAPYFVPASALGRCGHVAPSERITLGMIGIGNMGGGHLGGVLGNDDLQVVAVCDVDAKKRENAQKRVEDQYAGRKADGTFKGCDAYNEYERVLERTDIDAVLIATPDHWHAAISIAACEAGKDVYCEKPLALTIREAEQMVAAARRYGRVFQTGSQQRSDRLFRHACELVRNGRIGNLLTVNVGVGGPSREKFLPEEPVREGLDWERWLGPAPWQPYNSERCSGDYGGGWRHIRDYSGGMTTDWGAHHYDIALWGMGSHADMPVEIKPPPEMPAINPAPDPSKGPTMEFTFTSALRPDGLKMIHGGANGVLFTGTDGKVEVNRGYIKTWPEDLVKEEIGPSGVRLYRSDNHLRNWIDCIRTRSRPIADVEIGAKTITICHLANIAFWTGRTIRWDPEKREIVGDPSAARWTDRARRAPWGLRQPVAV